MWGGSSADDSNESVVALINMRGVIQDAAAGGIGKQSGISFQNIKHLVEQAFGLPKVLAVVLVINSPGGSPTQTNLIGSFIREKAEATKTPVFAMVEDIAASGGYWLACAADEIYIDPNSMVGSIGVIFQNVGVAEAMKKIGVEARVITSVKNKAGLNPFLKTDEKQEALVKENMKVIHHNFVDWVKKRRKNIKDTNDDVFSGRVFVGQEAVDKGLVDGVSNLTDLLADKFPDQQEDIKLIEVKRRNEGGLLSLLGHLFERGSKAADHLCDILETIQGAAHPTPTYFS